VAELIEALRTRGGGVGLFTGCAAGDTGGALVVRLDD
jgi:acetyl-CoA C-acetyltransferase